MKIAVIRHSIRNRGGDKIVLDYCNFLVRKGHEVIYWVNEINTHFQIDSLIQIKKIPYPSKKGTIWFALTTRLDRTDVVLVDLVVMAVFASVLNGKKTVYVAQDDDRTYYSSVVLRFIIQVFYWVAFLIFRVRTIVASKHLAKEIEMLAKGKMTVVPCGIDQLRFYHNDHSLYTAEKKEQISIVLYARSDFRKGLDIGVRAIEELARLRGMEGWELWTIGDDDVQINVDGLKIKRWGFLKGDKLRDVLSAADIYLSPSRHEGFGLMQLEAMACGNVMITTTGFSLLTDSVNGLVSPAEDWRALARNLYRVINDKDLFFKLRSNGFSLAKDYNLEKSCELFERALRGKIC